MASSEIRLDVHDLPGLSAAGSLPGGTFLPDVNGVTHPMCVSCPDPKYTEAARRAKINGTVVLSVTVGADGVAHDIQIVKSPGHGLDQQAVNAVQAWVFKPAMGPDGNPVAVVVSIQVTFRLLK
jgi:periplasmic protein TonB